MRKDVRFRLALDAACRLLSLRVMRFSFGSCASLFGAAALMLICSCEKHHVGEIPEVQKEHVELTEGSEEGAAETSEKATSPPPLSQPTPIPTPAEFFTPKPR
jgi:hypothetical protein